MRPWEIPLKETYDRVAADWVRDHQNDTWWIPSTEAYAAMLPPGGTILDVGCAGGYKAWWLTQRGFRVTGVDISPEMVKLARERLPESRFEARGIMDLDGLGETFDGVFCQAVLLHVPKAEAAEAVASMARRLKAGGALRISVKEVRDGQPDEEEKTEDDIGYAYTRHFSYYTAPELRALVEGAGLSIVEERSTPNGRTVWLEIVGRR
jgi:2-polyprenyl-3-methyl-5-hydroxy-6-metoxy-1,4-benzoquinol methylase